MTVIGDIYTGRERSATKDYNSSVLSIGTAGYPAIGGLLATLGWYYPFALAFIAVPISFVVLFSLRNPEPHNDQGLKEYFGSVWSNLRNREVFGLLGVSLFTFIILFGPQITYLPILMDVRFGAPPYLIGGVLSCASLTTALTSSQLGRLTGRFPERLMLKTAFVIYVVALVLVPFVPNVWLLILPAVLFGAAQSLNLPNVFSFLSSHAPAENRGAFMSVNGMTLRAGQTLGPLLMAATSGLVGLTGAFLAAITFLLVLFLIR